MELVNSINVNRSTLRDVYRYKGIIIYHDTIIPQSIFKPQKQYAVVDYIVDENENTVEWYTPDGKGLTRFKGVEVCLTQAKEFIDEIVR